MGVAVAALVVNPGVTEVPVGTASVSIPVTITGGDAVTDLAGVVEIDGGATFSAVSFNGSIWENALNGSFYAIVPETLPASLISPQAGVLTVGDSVSGAGTLLTLVVNAAALSAGDYLIRFTETGGGDSEILTVGATPTTFVVGILRILDDPLVLWRIENFGAATGDAALEATVWGDDADPDGDLLTNLMEFFLGTDPNGFTGQQASAGGTGRPVAFIQSDGGSDYFAFGYTRRVDPGSVSGEAESSGDLSAFGAANMLENPAPILLPGGLFEYVVERYNLPVSPSNQSRFFRLQVNP
ncbi:MAG: hypothetical protein ACFCU4_02580 [Puniceicoccaceae bacterium]